MSRESNRRSFYDSRVVIYDRRSFIRLPTGLRLEWVRRGLQNAVFKSVHTCVFIELGCDFVFLRLYYNGLGIWWLWIRSSKNSIDWRERSKKLAAKTRLRSLKQKNEIWLTPNIALRSGSRNLNGMFDTWSRLGVSMLVCVAFLLMSWWLMIDGVTTTQPDVVTDVTSDCWWLTFWDIPQSSPWRIKIKSSFRETAFHLKCWSYKIVKAAWSVAYNILLENLFIHWPVFG